jgi:hypothetical protein
MNELVFDAYIVPLIISVAYLILALAEGRRKP